MEHLKGGRLPGLASIAAGAYLLYKGWRLFRLRSLMDRMHRTFVRSLKPGFVELEGKAVALEPMKDPIFHEPCVYYNIKVEEKRWSGSKRNNRYVPIYHKVSDAAFLLDDTTGKVAVSPVGATSYLEKDVKTDSNALTRLFTGFSDKGENFMMNLTTRTSETVRIRASILRPGEPVYVLGWAFKTNANADGQAPFLIRSGGDLLVLADKTEESLSAYLFKRGAIRLASGLLLVVIGIEILRRL